ncbi:Gephyrin [Fusarium culmorum]|uniref:Gephyrin n=1 Tax=Fusarium culmorum TaxID=5516 RepID=A0A2T4GLP2_FUSCU|nr:Gephyrin [Fusarium culmorum]
MASGPLKAALLIVSTTAAKDASADVSGPILTQVLKDEGEGKWKVYDTKIVTDDVLAIQRQITAWTDGSDSINLVVTTGGTGFATGDSTPEAVTPLLHKQAPGLVHGMLAASLTVTPFAMMSRPAAGVRNSTIIVTLPGSPKGAKENLQAIIKTLPHACIQAAGGNSRAIHSGGVKKLEAEAGISIKEALALIEQHTPGPEVVTASVDQPIVNSVLAEDVEAKENVPAFRASIGVFPVTAISHAAPGEIGALKEGELARITTDDGKEEKEVEIQVEGVKEGENIREVGSDVKQGTVILNKGETISGVGGEIGLLASVGVSEAKVYRRPVVAVLSTGDEIVEYNRPGDLKLGEVRDTNRITLMSAAREWGYEVVDLGIASDKPGTLEETLRDGLRRADLLITTGGVSMGELDLLKPTIERSLGGTIHFGRVAMKPGKPTTFATVPVKDNAGQRVIKAIFSLPGNPASALVTFHLFVLPSLHKLSGASTVGLPRVPAFVSHDFPLDPRPEYHRAVVTVGKDGLLSATSTGGQRSSKVGSMRSANALVILPSGKGKLEKGSKVEVLLLNAVQAA